MAEFMTAVVERTAWASHEALARFVALQTCAALQTDAAVDVAVAALRDADLPAHPDGPKNWDTFLAVYHAMSCARLDAPMLDAGGERYSAFLPALRRLGQSSLTAINLDFAQAGWDDGIAYEPGDITATRFSSAHFQFVACLSVIEHGVNVAGFMAEMARILSPGGRLFISFDYWQEPIATDGLVAYSRPVQIFDAASTHALIDAASLGGLVLQQPFSPACAQRVVHWRRMGLRYTFANLLFRLAR